MRRYANSRLRLVLFAVLIVITLFMLTSPSHAQTAAPDKPAAMPKPSVWSLVMDNRDPVFYTIMALSITGMTLIIQGIIQNRASVFLPIGTIEQIREMIMQRRFKELMDFTETDPTFVSRALNPALKRAPSFSSMKEAMETAIAEQTAEQFRNIEYLNIIGNLGPLLGLLGTVLGMIDAFSEMAAQQGQASPATLAHGVSKALVHTMLGLMLAIPCLAAFGVLRTIVDRLTVRGALIAEEMLLMIKPAEARPPAAAMAPVSMGPPGSVPYAAAGPRPAAGVPGPPSLLGGRKAPLAATPVPGVPPQG
jgi:biopolymer transport protein ExbB